MSVQNGERLATKQDLVDMYQGILPYLGGMPEVVANKFSKGDLYSTDEKMIGQWIDSKPLYQKTVTTGGEVPSGATLIQRESQTGYDTVRYTKQTDSTISIGSDTDYSTEEKIVGTWIDGKPIWQRTFEVTTPSNITDTIILTKEQISSTLDKVVNINAIVMAQGGQVFNVPFYYSSGAQCNIYYSTTNNALYMGASNFIASQPCKITLQYTKTTT